MEINLATAHKITLIIDGEKEDYITTAETVGEFFKEIEQVITLSEHDEVSHSGIENISGNMEIAIRTAFPVEDIDGTENSQQFCATAGTVKELLDKNEISIGKLG